MQYNLLFIDDDAGLLTGLRLNFKQQGYCVDTAATDKKALELINRDPQKYAVVIMDYGIAGNENAALVSEIKRINSALLIIVYSANSSRDATKTSIQAGALDFIDKHHDFKNLESAIEQLCRKFEETTQTLDSNFPEKSADEELINSVGLIGKSKAMAQVAEKIILYQKFQKNVLILGESGVGKKLIAQALHNADPKSYFLKNCADYGHDAAMLRSELFGHKKGSFTGAISDKAGIFEIANGGTVFLDEIHELNLESQAMLLVAVEEKKIQRVGANTFTPASFRLIAAAKPDLKERVSDKIFKGDLYYRLCGFTIEIPPLRERTEDIESLVKFFCEKYFKETGRKKSFLMSTIRKMQKYPWPGNVRELENTVEKILVHSTSDTIAIHDLPREFFSESSQNDFLTYKAFKKRQNAEEKSFILNSLRIWGSESKTAKEIGIPRSNLRRIVEKNKIRKFVR